MTTFAVRERLLDSVLVFGLGLRLRFISHAWRVRSSSLLTGASAGLFSFAGDNFASIPFFFAICALGLAYVVGLKRFPPLLVVGVGLIVASVIISVPGALWWGSGDWITSAIIANWVLLFVFLAFMRLDLKAVIVGLAPSIAIQIALILWSGIVSKSVRPNAGLIESPNPAAGLLVVVALFLLMSPRWKWLALPCMVAVPFTGSRLAILTLAITAGLIIVLRLAKPAKTVLAIGATAVILVMPFAPDIIRIHENAREDIAFRLGTANTPGLTPDGFAFASIAGPPHNVPYRIANEWGYTAMLAWVMLTAWAMARGIIRKHTAWPLLFAVVLLGSLDYYVHVGALGWSWWLLLGLAFTRNTLASEDSEPHSVDSQDCARQRRS